jgi:hypothetical protein
LLVRARHSALRVRLFRDGAIAGVELNILKGKKRS